MRAALTDKDTFYFCATNETFFIGTSIHSEVILEITAAVDPVKGCSVTADSLTQYIVNRFMQCPGLFRRYGIGCSQRVKFRSVQSFIRVDVAKPGEKRLVQQQRLDLTVFVVKCRMKPLGGEVC